MQPNDLPGLQVRAAPPVPAVIPAITALTARPPSIVTRRPLLCAAFVLALAACNLFLGLGSSKVNDFEEGRYGVTAFEMRQQGSFTGFVVPTYAGKKELWALKPPLGYWTMALSFALFGASALALRLPSALCALAVVAITFAAARRWFDARLAVLAGLIVATTFGFLSHHGARSGDFDACLTLVMTLVAVQLPACAASSWRIVTIALLFGCAFLLKSFAIVPMGLVTVSYLLWSGGWRRQRPLPLAVAALLFAAPVAAWALARWHADGSPDFLLRMLREDVLDRSTSIVDRSTSSPWSYVTALFDRFAPWPPLMLGAALVALRARRHRPWRPDPVQMLLVLWIGVPLVFISFVRTQHHWYLDPIYPALAMAAAGCLLYLLDRLRQGSPFASPSPLSALSPPSPSSPSRLPPRRAAAIATAALLLPLAFAEARLLTRLLTRDRMPASQVFLSQLSSGAAAGCHEVRSTFRLAYSERFLLEVVDGLAVVEPSAAAARLPPRQDSCLLVGKSAWRQPPMPRADRLPPADSRLASSPEFDLYRLMPAVRPPRPAL